MRDILPPKHGADIIAWDRRPPFSSFDPSRPPQSQFMGLVIELLPVLFQVLTCAVLDF